MTVAEPPVDADAPSQVAYEELRGFAIAGTASGGLGLIILLREGLAATVALVAATHIHVGFSEFPDFEIAIATLPPWWGGLEVRRRRELVRALEVRTRELEGEEEV